LTRRHSGSAYQKERDREQEGEQNLHPGQRNSQLLEQLTQVSVEPLDLAFVAAGARISHLRQR
jgi:hypothetical protein